MSPKIEYPIIPEVEPVSLGPSFSIDRYVLRNVCTKFGAFVTSVTIRLTFRPNRLVELSMNNLRKNWQESYG